MVNIMPCGRSKNNEGVSVIIGAMLLILITVIAAASLAVIVSEAQKQDMDRKAQQAAVSNEKLSFSAVSIQKNVTNPKYIDSINFTLQNLNIASSRLLTFYINDRPAFHYNLTAVSGSAKDPWEQYDVTNCYVVNGGKGISLNLNFTDNSDDYNGKWYPVKANESLNLKVMTGYINTFNITLKPPSPVMKITTQTREEDGAYRDYLLLDSSDSSSERSIMGYNWTIYDVGTNTYYKPTGKVVQFFPESYGPFKINLTVIDDVGLQRTSESYTVPYSKSFNPPEDIQIISIERMQKENSITGINATVKNRRTADVTLGEIYVNNVNAAHYVVAGTQYNTLNPFVLSGGQISVLRLNFTDADNFTTPFALSQTEAITFDLFTALGNKFEGTVTPQVPPVPNPVVSVGTQNLGTITRDYLVLDGSGSTGEKSIIGWEWNISDGSAVKKYNGKVVQAYLDTNGPFRVNLTVTDSAGAKATSDDIVVPYDQNFNPVARIAKNQNIGNVICVTVLDVLGHPVGPGYAVSFTPQNGNPGALELSSYSKDTDSSGNASVSIINGSGVIRAFACGSYVDISYP